MKKVFIPLSDADGTMKSIDVPFGVILTSEKEAKKFQEEGGVGYTHSYISAMEFDTWKEAKQYCINTR